MAISHGAEKQQYAKAIDCSLRRLPALVRYADDGCQLIDNIHIENAFWSIVLDRKNWLRADAESTSKRAPMSLRTIVKANGHEPQV